MTLEITREKFIAATGREPEQDDLERCNCPHAGDIMHQCCGWNVEHDKPQFDIGPRLKRVAAGLPPWNGQDDD